MASSKDFKPTLIWSPLPYSSEQFGICCSCAFWGILWSGPILKASGLLAARVDFSFLWYSISLLPKFCWRLFLAASSSPIFFVGLLNFAFFFSPFFLLLSSCHVSESSRMKCMYSISPPVCSFYATIISRLAINTFCDDEWMNFDTQWRVHSQEAWHVILFKLIEMHLPLVVHITSPKVLDGDAELSL